MGLAFSAFGEGARARNMNFPFLCLQTNMYLGSYRGAVGVGLIFGVGPGKFLESEVSCRALLGEGPVNEY